MVNYSWNCSLHHALDDFASFASLSHLKQYSIHTTLSFDVYAALYAIQLSLSLKTIEQTNGSRHHSRWRSWKVKTHISKWSLYRMKHRGQFLWSSCQVVNRLWNFPSPELLLSRPVCLLTFTLLPTSPEGNIHRRVCSVLCRPITRVHYLCIDRQPIVRIIRIVVEAQIQTSLWKFCRCKSVLCGVIVVTKEFAVGVVNFSIFIVLELSVLQVLVHMVNAMYFNCKSLWDIVWHRENRT